jgi:hypothetical protein
MRRARRVRQKSSMRGALRARARGFYSRNTKSARARPGRPPGSGGSRSFGAQRRSADCEREMYGRTLWCRSTSATGVIPRSQTYSATAGIRAWMRAPAVSVDNMADSQRLVGPAGGCGLEIPRRSIRQLTLLWCRVQRDCVADHSPAAEWIGCRRNVINILRR